MTPPLNLILSQRVNVLVWMFSDRFELISVVVDTAAYTEERITCMDSKFQRVCGGVKSGKTEALLQMVCTLLNRGIEQESICVILNTANAVAAFKRRLVEKLGEESIVFSKLTISTIQLLAIGILDQEDARTMLARNPRILTKYESAFIVQDLKATGLGTMLIKDTFTSLGQYWSSGSITNTVKDDSMASSNNSCQADNLTELYTFLTEYLTTMQAMLPEELSYLCLRFLKQHPEQAIALGFDHFFVDDFQNLSKASQLICEMLCKESLVITGDTNICIANREAYPYPEGFTRFVDKYELATQINLDDTDNNRVVLSDSVKKSKISAQQILNIKWREPEEEINGISRWISKLAEDDMRAPLSELCLVVPNKYWARAFEKSLTRRHREFVTLLFGQILSGDPHRLSHCSVLLAFTKLNLLANPRDPIAWRCWCGIGQADLGTEDWKALLELARAEKLSITQALAKLNNNTKQEAPCFCRLQKRYLEGKDFIESHSTKRGYALLKAVVGEEYNKTFSRLIEPIEGNEDAQTAFKRAINCALDPVFNCRFDAVRIISYGELTGLSPATVVLVGLNDGLMPPSNYFDDSLSALKKERLRKEYTALFWDALCKASDTLITSTIQMAEQEMAESLNICVARLKNEHGNTMAMLSPSFLLQEAGSLIPGSESGQQFLNKS